VPIVVVESRVSADALALEPCEVAGVGEFAISR
jgi:hypothetical protein